MKISIKNLQKKIPIDRRKITAAINKVILSEKRALPGEINVSFINDQKIRELNRIYHGRDMSTDVLAFDLKRNKSELIADIYISADTALVNSRIYSSDLKTELCLYVIHGLLHILGYDDHKAKDIAVMRKKEAFYLKGHLPVGRQASKSQSHT